MQHVSSGKLVVAEVELIELEAVGGHPMMVLEDLERLSMYLGAAAVPWMVVAEELQAA